MTTEDKLIKEILYTEEEIQKRIKEVAIEINEHYKASDEIIIMPIIKGGLNYTYDLIKHIKIDLSISLIKASSYHLLEKLSTPKISLIDDINIKDKDVLLVDDIVDTGETLLGVKKILETFNPKSIAITSLFYKENNNEELKQIKSFVCWRKNPKGFLMGYGLDYDEKYRNLPYIAIISYN